MFRGTTITNPLIVITQSKEHTYRSKFEADNIALYEPSLY